MSDIALHKSVNMKHFFKFCLSLLTFLLFLFKFEFLLVHFADRILRRVFELRVALTNMTYLTRGGGGFADL